MKSGWLLPICLVLAALVVASGLLFGNRFKVAGGQVFDTFTGRYVDNTVSEENISKVTILKENIIKGTSNQSNLNSNSGSYSERRKFVLGRPYFIFTVQNKDDIKHSIFIMVTYYDKNNNPIATDESSVTDLNSGEIAAVTVYISLNTDEYSRYEYTIKPKE